MRRSELLASASTLRVRPLLPSDFGDDPISRFWRGIQFGWDDARDLEFQGLQPRYAENIPAPLPASDGSIWVVVWK